MVDPLPYPFCWAIHLTRHPLAIRKTSRFYGEKAFGRPSERVRGDKPSVQDNPLASERDVFPWERRFVAVCCHLHPMVNRYIVSARSPISPAILFDIIDTRVTHPAKTTYWVAGNLQKMESDGWSFLLKYIIMVLLSCLRTTSKKGEFNWWLLGGKWVRAGSTQKKIPWSKWREWM